MDPLLQIQYIQRDPSRLNLTNDQAFPSLGAFSDHIGCIPAEHLSRAWIGDESGALLLVLTFARKGELVLRLPIRDLVDAKPLVGRPQETWQMTFNILDVIQSRCQRIIDVDDDDLPIRLLLVE